MSYKLSSGLSLPQLNITVNSELYIKPVQLEHHRDNVLGPFFPAKDVGNCHGKCQNTKPDVYAGVPTMQKRQVHNLLNQTDTMNCP